MTELKAEGTAAPGGSLSAKASHPLLISGRPKVHKASGFRMLGKRVMISDDPGRAAILADQAFQSQLWATHTYPDGTQEQFDFGSGLITNVGMTALAADFGTPTSAKLMALANFHATGTGVTADAATDIALQTSAGPAPGSGTQSLVSAANLQKYQTQVTLSYTSGLAITEWGLFTSATLSASTGSPFTATTATSGTATATPFTASTVSVQGQTQNIVVSGTVYGYIVSNTTSVLTVPAWYTNAAGTAGSTPGSTATYTIQPVMLDHRVIAAINVVNGSTIQWTYQMTCQSGG